MPMRTLVNIISLLSLCLNISASDNRAYDLPSLGTDESEEYYHVHVEHRDRYKLKRKYFQDLSEHSIDLIDIYINYFENKTTEKKEMNFELLFIQSLIAQNLYVDEENRKVFSDSGELPSASELSKSEKAVVAKYSVNDLQLSEHLKNDLIRSNGTSAYYSGNYGPKDVVLKVDVDRYGNATITRYYVSNKDREDQFLSTAFDEFFENIDKTGINAREYTTEILAVFLLLEATPIDEFILNTETAKKLEYYGNKSYFYMKAKYDDVKEYLERKGHFFDERLKYSTELDGVKLKSQVSLGESYRTTYLDTLSEISLETSNLDYAANLKLRFTMPETKYYTEFKYTEKKEDSLTTLQVKAKYFTTSFQRRQWGSGTQDIYSLTGHYDNWSLSGHEVHTNGKMKREFRATKDTQIAPSGERFFRSFSLIESESGNKEVQLRFELHNF